MGLRGGRAVLGVLGALGIGCGAVESLPPLEGPAHVGALPPAELTDVTYQGFSSGERQVWVRAGRAAVEQVGSRLALEAVEIEFQEPTRGGIHVRAQRGTLDLETDDVVLEGDVVGDTGEGEHFETRRLRYDRRQQRLATEDPVRLVRRNLVLEGSGMTLDIATRKLTTGRVRALVNPE